MSEGLSLPPIPRHTLLLQPARMARLQLALPQIDAVLLGETDEIALQATLAALLWEALPHASFCGFYRRIAENWLVVGPYQGPLGCLRIPFDRGVCGKAASSGQIQLIDDVEQAESHIACDSQSRSELVIPVWDAQQRLRAVLDLDSHSLAAFAAEEAELLQALLLRVFANPGVFWAEPRASL